ncbi:hypothetical protein HDU91_000102 [Kappamyces sp. JEL0680]|nr:hypothetical protein HDU91_000102 [Kappamyces sp. JEL0680]
MSGRLSLQSSRKSLNSLSRTSSKHDMTRETLFKMSKKIAQLTKVIYYLNTKHEDGVAKIQMVTDTYEGELADTIRDGASIINELQLKLSESESKLEMQQGIIKVGRRG